jgi:hypothetical protein
MPLTSYFTNPLGLYALLALIPFIILYLIRPKPKPLALPTLQFLLKKSGKRKKSSFLRNLVSNLLFFLQLLIILLIAFSAAEPFFKIPSTTTSENIVIVLDTSASMSSGNLFGKAITAAKSSVGRRTSVVLIQDSPLIALDKGSSKEAKDVLSKLKPTISGTNVADAMSTALSLLSESGDGEIVVISDFRQTSPGDLLAARASAEAEGFGIRVVDVSKNLDNVGIVDLQVGRAVSKIFVKNYYEQEKTITLKTGSTESKLTLASGSADVLEITTPAGVTKIEILEEDNLPLDNVAYISTPEGQEIDVLLVTDNEGSFLQSALESGPSTKLEITHPPLIPDKDYDLVVFHDVDMKKLLPASLAALEEKVKTGLNVVFTYNDVVPDSTIFPLEVQGFDTTQGLISLDVVNSLTEGKEFGTVKKYYKAKPRPGTVVLASTQTAQPILVMRDVGIGKVFYFGIPETYSDFKYSPHYPLFWDSLLTFFEKVDDLADYNYKGGDVVVLDGESTVKKPSGSVKTEILIFDELGVYEFGGRKVVASLLNEKESDLRLEKTELYSSEGLGNSGSSTTKLPYNYAWVLLLLGLIIVLFELYYVKKGGLL